MGCKFWDKEAAITYHYLYEMSHRIEIMKRLKQNQTKDIYILKNNTTDRAGT